MGSNCCKGDAGGRPIRSNSSIYSRSRAGASLDERFTASDDAGGVRLTVSAARTGDTDVYTLQASNAAGSDSTKVRVEVSADEAPTGEDPPSFLRRLQDLTVKVGTRTRFLVEIVSSTECKVTWYRNERRLLEAERVALARDGNFWCADVAAVSVDDAGRWTCTAENAGGRASCSAHLNVLVPKAYKRPEFVEELRALLTEQGTVSLECKVVGVPTPLLRWFKDSREIKAGDVFALTANAEDPTSLGTYTCEAVNCMGRAYSSSKVHVVGRGSREGSARPPSSVTPEPPPIFTKELEDQFVRVSEPLTLSCHVVVPPWPRSVVWYNKEGKVEASERYHVLEDGAGGYLVEVAAAEWPDEGEWKCVATSSGGRVGISTCYVTMDVPKNYRKPRFMENLQAVLTEEGLVSFECKVVGFPTPVLSWFKDGQELKPGDVYQLTGTNSLGSYCCIARNCMGQASSSAELTVEDIQNQLNEEEKLQLFSKNQAPKFIQGLKSVEAKIDEPFRFTIKVAIPPEPSVLWYRDDQPVDESSRCHHGREERGVFYLDIQSLEFLDQAEWKCVAMNDFGHSVTSCFLKLIIPRHYKKPRFLENLQAILSDEGAVNLECKVIGVPQPVLKWYKDGEELKPGDIHRIISGQDGTCCLGTYTCEAQNCMGIAASSASLLGFDDSMKAKKKKAEEQALQRNLSLSTIHEERTSQMYDTPVGDVTTLDDKGEISFSFDGKEVSVSLYETPDLTEEEALQIVEMYADQLSENITEHNVVELPPLRFVKETSTSGNLLMEAVIIDVSPDYFVSPDEDMRTEADIEDMSIADENGPPQLSLDQDIEIGGEDYLEKTMALLSDEKSDVLLKFSRKKSDSQRSADDFFSLSRDPSMSEDIKRDDDTQAESFASAHSLGKPKSKSSKPSGEDGQESSEPTKTIVFKDEALKYSLDSEIVPVIKPKRERRTSRSSRRSSSGSEKSVSKLREEVLVKKESVEVEIHKKPQITENEFKEKMINVSTSLSKVINDVQIIERDIILKSNLKTSAVTASRRSLEIISSLISPLTEIHSITDAAREAASESKELTSTLFNNLPQPLKALQCSLTLIEKCIDMESDSRTLVNKTCVAFVETCGSEMQQLLSEINTIVSKDYLLTDDKVLSEIQTVSNEMSTVIKFSSDTIKARNLISEASEIKVEEPSIETRHLRDTQKAVFELKSPLNSLLSIVESADSGKTIDVTKVRSSEIILNDMSGSIQDLQTALEQIETLSVKESTSSLNKYNTEIIETVMESVVKLRNSFEQLSTESRSEEQNVLKQAVASIKENLHKISSQIDVVEKNVGTFDVLQNENKLFALQKMAQILIALENNLPRLDSMPEVKNHMTVFHKNLTKVLENVIESNEAKKYFTLMGICDAVNIINASIKNLDVDSVLALASLNNSLRIIQDQFITNVFDSELNCFILTNIADTLVGIQEAINSAEETSIQIDSEHLQELPPQELKESKAKVVVEHIDHAIAAIENLKTLESTQELKLGVTPTLETICPVLEELKRSVASIKASGIDEEHISDISDISSFAQTLASPLCELNQNIIVLNQQIVENIESMKDNSEVMATVAEPLHELNTTLEILQQEVISQYDENLTPYDISINMASAVQNLHSCILMIQEQAGVEAIDDMSTLEDISGIKTTADATASDRLLLPAAVETAIEPDISVLNVEQQTTATAQALQTLNEHITILQTPEIIDALDTLSEVSDYSSLKSFVVGLGELHSGIEEVLHPLLMEGSNEISNLINPSKLTAIAEPMQEIQQSLSVLDTSNIPIYENILELPTEKIHSVIQNLSEFKKHIDKCMLAVFPAMHNADNTVEIANKVGAIREVCEHLKEIIETTKAVEVTPIPKEVSALEVTVDNLLDATDVSKGIKIDQVKTITEELYEKITIVQEEIIQFTPHAPEKIAQEAKLIQTIDELQNNIAVLEQYDFVDLSRASDMTCMSPQVAVELESESLLLMEDIVDSAVNVVQDSTQETPEADLMIVEDFFKTCKNEFTILRCLISKATTHKKIIRLLQEFSSLQSTINDFKNKKFELTLSEDVNECLATFLIHADDCLQDVQQSLLKIVDSQSELLIEAPLAKFENSAKVLKAAQENKQDVQVTETVNKFVEILETAKPSLQNVQAEIVSEIKSTKAHVVECSTLANMIEEFSTFIEQEKSINQDSNTKEILEKVSTCIEKHQDYKDASGTGKTLILLKCLSDCTDVLQESLLEVKVPKPSIEEGPLKAVLTEMLEPIQALHKLVTGVQEQVLSGVDEGSISVDISTTESLVQTMTEKHKEIIERIEAEEAIANEEISLIMEVDKEIHSIQDSLRSIEGAQVAQVVKDIAKPVEDIEKSLGNILSPEPATAFTEHQLPKEKAKQLVQHIDQYIELIEIVEEISAVIKIEDINETMEIAKELRESFAALETMTQEETKGENVTEIRENQFKLAQKLQTALSALQVQVLDSAQELAPALSPRVLQRIARVTAQLQADLVAVTGIQVALQAPVEQPKSAEALSASEAIEKQTVSITTPELAAATLESKPTVLEQLGETDASTSLEQAASAIEQMSESTVTAESTQVITSETTVAISQETLTESASIAPLETIAVEGSENVVMEQTGAVPMESVVMEESNLSSSDLGQPQEVATTKTLTTESVSAVVIEDFGPVLHEAAPGSEEISYKTAELLEVPKATIDMLVQHIDEFMSDDITEVINILSDFVNAEELKETISIVKELRENIAASEVELKAETSDVLKEKVDLQRVQLVQNLHMALAALENVPLDTLAEVSTANKEIIQRVTEITENLRADLTAVTSHLDVTENAKSIKAEEVVTDVAQVKDSKSEPTKTTDSTVQVEITKSKITSSGVTETVSEHSTETTTLPEIAETAAAKGQSEAGVQSEDITISEFKEIQSVQIGLEKEAEPISLEEVTEVSDVKTGQAAQKTEEEPLVEAVSAQAGLFEHIQEFTSDSVSNLINEIAQITNSDELKESVELAKALKESIEFSVTEETGLLEETKADQVELVQKLQHSLSTLHAKALESAEEIAPAVKPDALQRVSEIITYLQDDLNTAMVSGLPEVRKAAEIVEILEDENSMKQLEELLQKVTDKINLPTDRDAEDTEDLKDTLDEVQTVIIKLKQDYDGAMNDTLNETLEDLECSVRSVQLQINEDSPPELLKEACATLQLLVNNMNETQEVRDAETVTVKVPDENILEKCSAETDSTVTLLEEASKISITDSNLTNIVSSLNVLKNTVKFLKLSFEGNADALIEHGVEVVQNLDLLEEKVFSLEKDLSEARLSTEMRDTILTAVHSVYGSISNMRGTISSIQKRYMFEHYGKPSETILRSIKNITRITEIDSTEKQAWKKFSKSLRKVLNHFEDIKFYINLDKTARLPSDAAFTKIILEELKSNICEVLIPQASVLGEESTVKVNSLLECVNKNLTNIESKLTLEVKEKIPVFKELALLILDVTDLIKVEKSRLSKEKSEVMQPTEPFIDVITEGETQETSIDEKVEVFTSSDDKLHDDSEVVQDIASEPPSASQEPQKTIKKKKQSKQVCIQEAEPDVESQIEQIASELVAEIATEAITVVQNLKDAGLLGIAAGSSEFVEDLPLPTSEEQETLEELQMAEDTVKTEVSEECVKLVQDIEENIEMQSKQKPHEQSVATSDEQTSIPAAETILIEDQQVASTSTAESRTTELLTKVKTEGEKESKQGAKEDLQKETQEQLKAADTENKVVKDISTKASTGASSSGVTKDKSQEKDDEKEEKPEQEETTIEQQTDEQSPVDSKDSEEHVEIQAVELKQNFEEIKPEEVTQQTEVQISESAEVDIVTTDKQIEIEDKTVKELDKQHLKEKLELREVEDASLRVEEDQNKATDQLQALVDQATQVRDVEEKDVASTSKSLDDVKVSEITDENKASVKQEQGELKKSVTGETEDKSVKEIKTDEVVTEKDIQKDQAEKQQKDEPSKKEARTDQSLQKETEVQETIDKSEQSVQSDSSQKIEETITETIEKKVTAENKEDEITNKAQETIVLESKQSEVSEEVSELTNVEVDDTVKKEEILEEKEKTFEKEHDEGKSKALQLQGDEIEAESEVKQPQIEDDVLKQQQETQEEVDKTVSKTEEKDNQQLDEKAKVQKDEEDTDKKKQKKEKKLKSKKEEELKTKKETLQEESKLTEEKTAESQKETTLVAQIEKEQLDVEKKPRDDEAKSKQREAVEEGKQPEELKSEIEIEIKTEEIKKDEQSKQETATSSQKAQEETEDYKQEKLETDEKLKADKEQKAKRAKADERDQEQADAEKKQEAEKQAAEREKQLQEELQIKQDEELRAQQEKEVLEQLEKDKTKEEKKRKKEDKLEKEAKAKKEKEEAEKREQVKLEAEKCLKEEEAKLAEEENAQKESEQRNKAKLEAEKKQQEEMLLKQEAEKLAQKENEEKEKLAEEKERKKEENLKQEQKAQEEAEKLEQERLEAKKKLKEEELERAKEEHAQQEREKAEKDALEAEQQRQEELRIKQEEELKAQKEKEEKEKLKEEKKRKKEEKLKREAKENAEKEEAEKLEREKIEAEKKQREQEKLEAEKKQREQEKLEAEKKQEEQEKLEAEKKQEEQEKLEAEKKQEEQEKLEAEKKEQEKLEAEKKEQEKLEAEKKQKEQEKLEAEKKKKEQEKLETEKKKKEQEKLETERKEQEKLEAEKKEKEKLEAEKKEQEKLEAEKKQKEQEKLETEKKKKEQEKLEAEKKKKEQEKLEAERKEQEKLEAEKKQKEQEKLEAEKKKKEQEKLEAERKEQEKLEAEKKKKEQEKLEAEKKEKEKLEAEKKKKEQEKLEAEKKEKEKLEAERKEQEKLEAEKKKKEQEKLEAEKKEKEKLEAEKKKKEQEKLEAEKKEKEKLEAERKEQEKLEAEKKEKEKLEAERKEQEKLEAEKKQKEQEKLEAEKKEKERLEAEKNKKEQEKLEAEKKKKEQEKLEAEKKEKERLEAEKKKKEQEKLEAERKEQEKLEAEKKKKEQEKLEAEKKKKEQEKLEAEKKEQEKLEAEKKKKEQEKLEAEKKQKEQEKEAKLKKDKEQAELKEKAALEAKNQEEAKAKQEAEKRKQEESEAEQKRIRQEKEAKDKKDREEAEDREKETLKAEKKRKKEEKQKQEAKVKAEKEEADKREQERLKSEKKQKEQEKQAEEEAKAQKEKEDAEKKRQEELQMKQEVEEKKLKEEEEADEREKEKKRKKQEKEKPEVDGTEKREKEKLDAEKKQKKDPKQAKAEKEEAKEREKKKLEAEKIQKDEMLKQEEDAVKAKKLKAETEKIKQDEEKAEKLKREESEAEIKRKEKERIKQEQEMKVKKEREEAEQRQKEELEAEKKRKREEKLKKEQKEKAKKDEAEAKKLESEKLLAEKKLKEEEQQKREQEIKDKKQKELDKLEQEKKQAEKERLEKERLKQEKARKEAEEEERSREEKVKEKKKLIKKRKEEEEALRKQAEEADISRKIALKKKKDEEKARLLKEQEEEEARELKLRETERRIREERRREIEKDLNENYKQMTTADVESTSSESRHKKEENGFSLSQRTDKEDHYIREYHYEPSRQRVDERSKFVDHNNKDYTMEFSRPSGYRERTFEHEKFTERESLGKNATIYKAQTIILDSQLRSSVPPQLEKSDADKRAQRYDRSESEKRFERHKSKALSEARSMITEKRSSVSRDLKRKPVFSTYLTDRTAVEGSRVKLTCSVLSSADPKITWYKNGVFLVNKLKYKTKFIDGLITLEVLNAVVSDSAEYSCTVENENGSVSSSANLKVYPSFEASPIPPTFTRSIRDTYHLAENELVLECRIRGQPLPSITWLKDDRPVAGDERYQAFYLADGVCRLAVSAPTPADSGKYTCKAENSVWADQIHHVVSFTGKDRCLSPNIATKERSRFNRQAMESRRPHFTNVLSDYKVAQGGTIGLQVEIRGCPTRVEWLREGRSVTEVYRNARTFVEQGLYTLALSDVTEKESGMYTCRAWSTHGNVDMNAAITVVQPNELEGKPAIIVGRPEKDILISVGEDVNISFRVQGEPKPKVVFMKGIRDITTSQRVCKMTSDDYVKFTLKRSVVADAGTYCILARNAYGCDRAFVTVVVRQRASSENLISDWTYPIDDSSISLTERKYKSVPERIPGEPSVVDGGSNWVSLAWPKPAPRDAAPVLAYRVDCWLSGKDGGARWLELGITPLNSFDAFNLKQGEEYHFRVTPRNRYGWGESVQTSTPIGIGLAGDRPEFVDILPGQLKVLAGETANLSCSVKGKPLPEVVWMKNGHEIEEEEGRVTTAFNGQDCSLRISRLCSEDEARYSCEASNAHGRASTYARLAVVTDRLVWEADAKLKRERSQDAEGEYPPQFTMRLRDRRVQATYPVRLTCQLVGSPPPTLTWFKDGDTLQLDSRRSVYQDEHFHTLEIAPTTLEDGGVYEAMARNSSGAVSCRCSLVVDKGIRAYVAPEFCCGLEPLYRLCEGDELRISAVVEAYPSVGVTWYRDGVRLRPSRRAIMTLDRDGQIELALAFVTGRDAGVYTCTASNEVGRASTSGKVEVIEGDQPRERRSAPVVINAPDVPYSKEPMFVRKPRSSEAREGDTVIIACEVIGDPKPDVYWLRDFLKPDYYRDASHFKRVGEGPEYRFEIPHAKLDYTGAYSVVARNVHGEAKAIISLQILAKDPSSTDDSHNVRYGRVEVIPRFERELTDLLSYDGDAVEFECHVTGNPEPDIRWFHYNELIRDCLDFEASFEEGAARLKIRQVTAEDEGTYSCEASNNLGKATSSACLVVYPPGEPNTLSQRLRRPPALLSAASTPRSTPRSTPARSVSRTPGPEPRRLCSPSRQMPPSFYTYPFNKVVEEGEQVTFKCAVKGLPAPWATWDKDGIIITPSARVTLKEKDELLRILEIEQVTIEDVGVYRITIENEFGRAEASARLEVITQKGKFYGGVRAYSPSPRKSLSYRRYPSVPRQD
ncbi:unnamed protein product [Chrysodeixis includens]|uniref:Titin homolog n=1 Tax=Chrysodeixis includens TaxID=689277 RepID=A0A9P0BND8_CHRIL|nr:unnamed protein product [Chrysodeixis includens]